VANIVHYDVGDLWVPQATFTVSGTPTDPTTLTVRQQDPAGVETMLLRMRSTLLAGYELDSRCQGFGRGLQAQPRGLADELGLLVHQVRGNRSCFGDRDSGGDRRPGRVLERSRHSSARESARDEGVASAGQPGHRRRPADRQPDQRRLEHDPRGSPARVQGGRDESRRPATSTSRNGSGTQTERSRSET
jgi:hypothetical protein